MNKVLDICLAQIERGELSIEECLALYPDISGELRPLLEAGSKLAALKDLSVNPKYRALNRSRLLAHMAANPRRKPSLGSSLAFRYAAALTVFMLAFMTAGTALAQNALPGDALYSWKLASERLWRSVQQDRVEADLIMADRRVLELNTVRGIAHLETIGMNEYAGLLLELRLDVSADPRLTQLVNETLGTHKQALRDFFANSKAELPNPEELFLAIPVISKPDLPPAGEEHENDSNLDLPLVVPPPVKKNDGEDSDSGKGLFEEVLDELFGQP